MFTLTTTHQSLHSKWVNFVEYELYLKKFLKISKHIHNKLWKILKEMGIPDHLTCLLRNLCAGQEAIVRTGRGTTDWFQIVQGVHQGCILSLCIEVK